MAMQTQWFPDAILLGLPYSENLAALRMEDALFREIVNPFTWLKGGIELNEGFGPEDAGIETLINVLFDSLIPNLDEAPDV